MSAIVFFYDTIYEVCLHSVLMAYYGMWNGGEGYYMTLYQLKIFEAVARHANITQASLALHASQPAVSQQLKLVQDEYGVRFLNRLSHGVELTPEGRGFLGAIKPVLAQIENIDKRFKGNRKGKESQTLLVGGSGSISVSILPGLLMEFRKNHPGLGFVLETNDSRTMERRGLDSELDIAIIVNPSRSPRIVYEPYAKHTVVAFAAPSCPMIGRTVSLKELGENSLVVRTGSIILDELVKLGSSTHCAIQCEAPEAVKAAVFKGLGVGVLHRESVEHDLKTGELKLIHVPELEKLLVRSYIIYDGRKQLHPAAQDFLRLLHAKRKSIMRRLQRRARSPHPATDPLPETSAEPRKIERHIH